MKPKLIIIRSGGVGGGGGSPGYSEFAATIPGDLTGQDEAIFGYFRAPADGRFRRINLDVLAAPTGSGITADLITGAGVEQGVVATLDAAATGQSTDISDVVFAAGDVFRFKVKSVGSTYAGDTLTARAEILYDATS